MGQFVEIVYRRPAVLHYCAAPLLLRPQSGIWSRMCRKSWSPGA
jgi:hypothetical protein